MRTMTAHCLRRIAIAGTLLLTTFLAAPTPLHAADQNLQKVLNTLAQYKIIDQDVANAGPVVECALGGQSVESCVQQLAASKADELLKSDSKLVLAVDVVKAFNAGDWVRLLELSGTKVLKVVVCDIGMAGLGPVSGVICSGTFDLMIDLAQTVVADAVDAVAHEEYWRLITLVGPKLACDIIPGDSDVHDVACGVLGKIWTGMAQAAGAAVNLVADVGQAFTDGLQDAFDFMDGLLGTAPPQQSPAKYYMTFVASYYMNGVAHELGFTPTDIQSDPSRIYDNCMQYFGKSGVCGPMRDRYVADVAAYAQALTAWRESYFAAEIRPAIPYYYVKWVQKGKPMPFAGFDVPLSSCMVAIKALSFPTQQYPYPAGTATPPTPHRWACTGAKDRLAQVLKSNQVILAAQLAALEASGCQTKRNGKLQFPFWCGSPEAYQRCKVHFASTELVRPSLDRLQYQPVDQALCNYVVTPVKQRQPAVAATGSVPPFADILADPAVTVLTGRGGIAAQWGEVVQLSESQKMVPAPETKPGMCRFGLGFTVRNGGTGTSPSFANQILVNDIQQGSRTVSSLAPGTTALQRLYFDVGPERSIVALKLDATGQVAEVNESNNEYRLPVFVSGTCGAGVTSSTAPSAPAPQPSVAPQLIDLEGESFVQSGEFTASAGRVTTGPADSYTRAVAGSQLLWSGGAPGAVLELRVNVPVAAAYAIEIHYTSGPAYGNFQMSVDGEKGGTILGYSPTAMPSRPLQAGRFGLTEGPHKIVFTAMDKYAASSGYALGIDAIRLYPAGPLGR